MDIILAGSLSSFLGATTTPYFAYCNHHEFHDLTRKIMLRIHVYRYIHFVHDVRRLSSSSTFSCCFFRDFFL